MNTDNGLAVAISTNLVNDIVSSLSMTTLTHQTFFNIMPSSKPGEARKEYLDQERQRVLEVGRDVEMVNSNLYFLVSWRCDHFDMLVTLIHVYTLKFIRLDQLDLLLI